MNEKQNIEKKCFNGVVSLFAVFGDDTLFYICEINFEFFLELLTVKVTEGNRLSKTLVILEWIFSIAIWPFPAHLLP